MTVAKLLEQGAHVGAPRLAEGLLDIAEPSLDGCAVAIVRLLIHASCLGEKKRQAGPGAAPAEFTVAPERSTMMVVKGAFTDQDASVALQRLLEVTAGSFEERAQLQRALESRIVIEQAKGMLAERLRLSIDEAFEVLRRASRSSGTKIHAMAARVLNEPDTPVEVVVALRQTLEKVSGGDR